MQVVIGILTLFFLVRFTMIKNIDQPNMLKVIIYVLLFGVCTFFAIPFIDELINPSYANLFYELRFDKSPQIIFNENLTLGSYLIIKVISNLDIYYVVLMKVFMMIGLLASLFHTQRQHFLFNFYNIGFVFICCFLGDFLALEILLFLISVELIKSNSPIAFLTIGLAGLFSVYGLVFQFAAILFVNENIRYSRRLLIATLPSLMGLVFMDWIIVIPITAVITAINLNAIVSSKSFKRIVEGVIILCLFWIAYLLNNYLMMPIVVSWVLYQRKMYWLDSWWQLSYLALIYFWYF